LDKEKFITVVKDHQNLIFKICYSYCSNSENRKDLQQEILMQLWKLFAKFDGRVKLSTCIYRIALNTAISYYRNDSKQSDKKVSIDTSVISLSDIEYVPDKAQNIAIRYQFIENLNQMDKALILLYLDDNKYKDIAEIFGISETNVATKIGRISRQKNC
jgi:RNA polymerase sigma-70 factor (ECF subfamily)